MPSLVKWLAAITLLVTTALATPVDASPAATTTCNPATTFVAKFEKLTAGKSVPSGFGGAKWSGWTVADPTADGLLPFSTPKAILSSDGETSSIIINSANVMTIQSFYFGCTIQLPGGNPQRIAAPYCDLVVTSRAFTYQINIQSAGPFGYTSDFESSLQGIPQNMTRVDLDMSASAYYFQVVGGASSAALYLDNVVLEQPNPSCPFGGE